ncbi:single-stranded-DNA-specific exonuclease RecJ, partial [Thermodesulfobacteriota bacterium]
NHIEGMALPRGVNLIITADCGSGSHVAAKAAKKADIDIVITDHHNIAEHFPGAVAVVNPKRPDCNAGFHTLAGVGVAFFLVVCLRAYLREKKFWNGRAEPNLKNFCDLVALGTVADMVPLVDENRIFTRSGLQVINSGYRRGIRALIETCNINKQFVDTDDIAYRLAPRLNAAGRVAHANAAVELLISQDIDSARQMSADLNAMNARRQRIEKTIMEEILVYLKHEIPLAQKKTLVLSHQDWHEGVLGIVASRIAAKFYRPAALISTKHGIGKGSVRSVPGIDIHEVLTACEDSLESFGGHSMAAGLQIRPENINRFKEQFENATRNTAAPGAFIRGVSIDYELDFRNISDELIDALESLQPFGAGNPEPLFMAQNVKIQFAKIVGKNHRRLLLKQDSDSTDRAINAIQFNIDPRVAPGGKFDQIAYKLRWNRWQEKKSPQIIIEET